MLRGFQQDRVKSLPWVIPNEGALPEELTLLQLSKRLGIWAFDDQHLARLDNVELTANLALPEDWLPILELQCVQSICQQIPMLLQDSAAPHDDQEFDTKTEAFAKRCMHHVSCMMLDACDDLQPVFAGLFCSGLTYHQLLGKHNI